MSIRMIVAFTLLAGLVACAETPERQAAALTAIAIERLEDDIQAKLDAEGAFTKQIAKDGKFAAEWNVRLGNEVELLRTVQEFSDLALTERAGVPRIALQDFLRVHNERSRDAAADAAAAVAVEEARFAVTFHRVVFQRAKWRDAREATLQLARKSSSKEQFRLFVATAQEGWQLSQEAQQTMTSVADEPLKQTEK